MTFDFLLKHCDFNFFRLDDIPGYYEFFVSPDDEDGQVELFEKRFDLKIPQCLDTVTFRRHMASVKWLWPAIKCQNCRVGILDLKAGGTRMMHSTCESCVKYLCGRCDDDPDGPCCRHGTTREFIT